MKRDLLIVVVVLIVVAAVVITAIVIGASGNTDQLGNPSCPGCGIRGPGMMGPGVMGPGMMSGMTGMMAVFSQEARPISEEEARTRAEAYAGQYGPGVTIGDFMEFSLNYYVELKDATGSSIAEILVDRFTGAVSPEPGPNMMWNTRYGSGQGISGGMPYDADGAKTRAGTFLASYLPGATIQEEAMTFPGYYTLDFGRGQTEGMLSVNAHTGDIWVHTWHGQYIGG
jgi:hypothetical protein